MAKGVNNRSEVATSLQMKRVDSATQNRKKRTQLKIGAEKDVSEQIFKEESPLTEDSYLTQFAEKEMTQFNTNIGAITIHFEEKQTEEDTKQKVVKTAKLNTTKKNRRKFINRASDDNFGENVDKDDNFEKKLRTVFNVNGNHTQEQVYEEVLSSALVGLRAALEHSASNPANNNQTPSLDVPESIHLQSIDTPPPVFTDIPPPRMYELLRKPEVRKQIKPKDLRFNILTPPWKPQPIEEYLTLL
jgi:hypothetical protein